MFGIGGFELFIIILFGFLVFGPDKLPEIAKTVGMAINKFKKAKDEMDGVIKEEIFDPTSDQPFKNPVKAAERARVPVREKTKRDDTEETFAERKARYDRERAEAKKRALLNQREQDRINANRAKMKQEAAQKAQVATQDASATVSAAPAQDREAKAVEPAEALVADKLEPNDSTGSTRKPSAAELYGNVPMNKQFVRESNGASSASSADSGAVATKADVSAEKAPEGGER